MTQLRKRIGGVCALLWCCALGAAAGDAQTDAWHAPRQQVLYEELLRELRCLVCANQNLRDSNADLAKDLRAKTRELILAGRNRQEIIDYMAQRYGEYVRYRPRFTYATAVLWLAPFCLVFIGLGWGIARARRSMRTPARRPKSARA